MMMLLAPSVLNPCILPLLDTVTTFFPRLIIIQHIKRRRRVRFESEGDLGRHASFRAVEKSRLFTFPFSQHMLGGRAAGTKMGK